MFVYVTSDHQLLADLFVPIIGKCIRNLYLLFPDLFRRDDIYFSNFSSVLFYLSLALVIYYLSIFSSSATDAPKIKSLQRASYMPIEKRRTLQVHSLRIAHIESHINAQTAGDIFCAKFLDESNLTYEISQVQLTRRFQARKLAQVECQS